MLHSLKLLFKLAHPSCMFPFLGLEFTHRVGLTVVEARHHNDPHNQDHSEENPEGNNER